MVLIYYIYIYMLPYKLSLDFGYSSPIYIYRYDKAAI